MLPHNWVTSFVDLRLIMFTMALQSLFEHYMSKQESLDPYQEDDDKEDDQEGDQEDSHLEEFF
jgi:hypothetical protein